MPALPTVTDPTLAAVDRALEERAATQPPRPYLGASAIGRSCSRALWYGFRWVKPIRFSAETLKRFDDGHRSEAVMAARIQATPGMELWTLSETGRQFGFSDLGGHFRGHIDGVVLGLLQAPATPHIWEHKAVNEKKLAELGRLKAAGEKAALAAWDPVYYAQGVLYMHYFDLTRHWLTASSPGVRSEVAVRTDADPATALRTIAKARRIVEAAEPPEGISRDPSWFECCWCEHNDICHGGAWSKRNCRTCLHATAVIEDGSAGRWFCERWSRDITTSEQAAGCPAHKFIPALVPGEVVDADPAAGTVRYRLRMGADWIDGEAA